jgi:hypothetical protein
VYSGGSYTPLSGSAGSILTPFGINDQGDVVGNNNVLYNGSTYSIINGPPGSTNLEVYGINDSNQIVGDAVLTPLPSTLPLFVSGIGVLGLLGRRRKREG